MTIQASIDLLSTIQSYKQIHAYCSRYVNLIFDLYCVKFIFFLFLCKLYIYAIKSTRTPFPIPVVFCDESESEPLVNYQNLYLH